jgi:hypothetical protein
MDWDPRAKFPHGMMVFARVTHHVFHNNWENELIKNVN